SLITINEGSIVYMNNVSINYIYNKYLDVQCTSRDNDFTKFWVSTGTYTVVFGFDCAIPISFIENSGDLYITDLNINIDLDYNSFNNFKSNIFNNYLYKDFILSTQEIVYDFVYSASDLYDSQSIDTLNPSFIVNYGNLEINNVNIFNYAFHSTFLMNEGISNINNCWINDKSFYNYNTLTYDFDTLYMNNFIISSAS